MSTDDLLISASQMNKFATCEMSWSYGQEYPEVRDQMAPGRPLLLGTLMHTLIQAWYQLRDWREEIEVALSEDPYWESGFDEPEEFTIARGIMEDWTTFRGERPDTPAVSVELPFDLPVPGVKGARVRGFLDGVLAPVDSREPSKQGLTIMEIKTMGRWGRERLAPVDPQLLLYAWAARQIMPVEKFRFEAVSTYPYKDPRPEKRFKRLEWRIDDDKVAQAVENMARMARRMKVVKAKPETAIFNFSQNSCSWCDHKDKCWGDLPEILETKGSEV